MAATIFIALIYFLLSNVLRSHTNQSFIQEIKEYHYLSGIGGKGIISHQRDSLLEYLKSLNLSLHTKWLTTKSKTPRRIRFTICKWSKHGDTCLSTPERSHVADLTVCIDVHPNPGWDSTLSLPRSFNFPAIRNLSANEATAFNRSSYLNANFRGYGSSTFNCLSLTTPRYFRSFNVERQVRKYRRSRGGKRVKGRRNIREKSLRIETLVTHWRPQRISQGFRTQSNLIVANAYGKKTDRLNHVDINTAKPSQHRSLFIKFATWNAHSVNRKSATICDLIISKQLDILAVTETWQTEIEFHDNNSIAEILNTLVDYDFYHVPRLNRAGGGTGVFLRKGFSVHKNDTPIFTSMECIDLTIKPDSRSSIRLITVYRPTRSQKNRATVSTFFNEFSLLLESVNLTPGYLLINGDLNFHMDVSDNVNASAFRDLLESAGLKQHVSFPTHRCGHTLDLIIDRQADNVVSAFSDRSDLPSDHYAVLCTIAFQRPKTTKSQVVFRKFCDMDIVAWKEDILSSDLHNPSSATSNNVDLLADQYNAVLSKLIDKHAQECSRSVTLRPNAPWFNDTLKAMKRRKRKLELQ